MTTIYKQRINAGRLSGLKPETLAAKEAEIKHVFNITSTVLQYKIQNVTDNETYCNIKLDLSTLKNHSRICDQSIYSLTDVAAIKTSDSQYTVSTTDLDNTLDNTFTSKRKALFFIGDDTSSQFPMKIFVDSVNGDFTTFSYIVLSPDMEYSNTEDLNQTITVETNIGNVDSGYVSWKEVFSPITAVSSNTNAAAGDNITVNVTCQDTDVSKIYAEAISGIVDKTEIPLTNGQGSFAIITNTLSTGDFVKVKLGYKLFTNVVAFEQTLK
jgi:hypothetical protein